MNSSYEAWARYDVDDALERIDAQEQQEQLVREKQRKVAEKRHAEESISRDAEQSAEVLAAHAAVAALKAKGRHRGKKTEDREKDGERGKEPGMGLGGADQLQKVAELMKRKHELIKETMEAKRRGDELAQTANWDAALEAYKQGLESAKALLVLAPESKNVPSLQNKDSNSGECDGNQQDDSHAKIASSHSCSTNHEHERQNCKCESKRHVEVFEKPPQKDDLEAVATMFLKDCYLGVGTCEMGRQHYAAGSEAFKEVLLRDQSHMLAWLQRGRAFEQMDSPLLAWLHYTRVTSLDSGFEDAQEKEVDIKHAIVDEETTDSNTCRSLDPATSLKDALLQIKLCLDAANVMMIEGFFDYAAQKYEAALRHLAATSEHANMTPRHHALVSKLKVTCHLNIASCLLETKKHYTKAIRHCDLALEVEPGHILVNFRLGQVHRAMHSYESSLGAFETARALLQNLPLGERTLQLKSLEDEIDKCQFDRGQHDLAYIREQLQRERSA